MNKIQDFFFTNRNGKGDRINEFYCTNKSCGHTTSKAEYADRDEGNLEPVSVHVTLGFYGPNGNGFTYSCRKCNSDVGFITNYNALDQFFGFRS